MSSTTVQIKSELLAALGRDLGEALQALVEKVDPVSPRMRDIIHQSGRYYNARSDFQNGLVDTPARDLVFNQVRNALLDLVTGLTDADIHAPGTDAAYAAALGLAPAPVQSPLHLLFARLKVDWKNVFLSQLHLVNCNRSMEFRTLKRALRDRGGQGQRFQFYFINACPKQRPESFAERIILELLHNLDEEETEAIQVRRVQHTHRLKIEELPFDFMGLAASKKKLARYFAERFNFQETIEPVEDFLRACIGKMKDYRYVAFIFRIDANDWEPFFPEYLQWIMDTLASVCEDCPTCLFFFPVWVRNLHESPPQALREVAEAVARLGEAQNAVSTVISPLSPVDKEEVEDWFVDFGEPDEAKVNEIILLTLQREKNALARVERFLQQGVVDMYDVEALQEAVYEFAHT